MNAWQLHKIEYLLHLLEDEDLDGCMAFLGNPVERRKAAYFFEGAAERRRRGAMSPRVRAMFKLTLGMACVSISSLVLAVGKFPFATLVVPLYFLIVALMWTVKTFKPGAVGA